MECAAGPAYRSYCYCVIQCETMLKSMRVQNHYTGMLRGTEQEAQLLQRDRAMLRITEYFAKLLKITQGH